MSYVCELFIHVDCVASVIKGGRVTNAAMALYINSTMLKDTDYDRCAINCTEWAPSLNSFAPFTKSIVGGQVMANIRNIHSGLFHNFLRATKQHTRSFCSKSRAKASFLSYL